ncbi:hypothetical protein ACFPN1_15980 [Lysobacter yangpyeongensis]|uniref:DUF4279 domain-containing protein n=1 Tax=Lysobacter yangpyeongensis TaxID=346182 RepID=A0ABW0SRN0_9GAMM
MPSCVLRVSGSTAKVRQFLAQSGLQPLRVFWKGEARPGGRVTQQSGFNIELSAAEGLSAQARQAVRFARQHQTALSLIPKLGFRAVSIDFGLYDLATEDQPWPSYSVPTAVAQLAAELGATIELSFYGVAEGAP